MIVLSFIDVERRAQVTLELLHLRQAGMIFYTSLRLLTNTQAVHSTHHSVDLPEKVERDITER